MRIGIVIGSVRQGRLGASVGAWVADRARALDASSVPGGVEWTVPVAYGGLGGVRANEAWRTTTAAYNMHVVGDSVNLVRRLDFPGGELALTDHHDRSLDKVLRRLVDLTHALTGDRAVTGP